jgi:DNA-binding NarL/FixJ family response regulator
LIRILIVAEAGLRPRLEQLARDAGAEVASSIGQWDRAATLAADRRVDAILTALDGAPDDWPDAARAIDLPAAFLVDEVPRDWFIDSQSVPPRAFLPRDATSAELRGALAALAAGLWILHPALTPAPPLNTASALLSPRESQVLRMLADGLANKEIAFRLGISEHTAKYHVASILDKLGVSTRTEAVTAGIRRGIVLV